MEEIHIHKKDEVYLKVECDRGIAMELSGYFEFEVPGASFMPSVRNKMWDGKIRLYNIVTGEIYMGLLPYIEEYLENNGEKDFDISVSESGKNYRILGFIDKLFLGLTNFNKTLLQSDISRVLPVL